MGLHLGIDTSHQFAHGLGFAHHEYFRRILCNLIGTDVEKGKLPASELAFLGQMVEDISYNNANNFFKF